MIERRHAGLVHRKNPWIFILFSSSIELGLASFLSSLLPPPSSQLGFLWPLRKETTLSIKLSLYALVFQFCFSFKSFENNIGFLIVIFCALISKFIHQRCWEDGTRSQELQLSWRRIIWKVWIFERTTAVVTFIKNYLLK